MATLGLIVPFFGKTGKDKKNFIKWLKRSKTKEIFRELGIDDFNMGDLFPEDALSEGGNLSSLGIKFEGTCPKAFAVYLKLMQLKKDSDCEYYLMIDGTGIEYDYIFEIIRALKILPVDVALACRVSKYRGISKERVEIEKFENSILSEMSNTTLPDCQCGCWGFKKNFLNYLSRMGHGFELEVEILMDAIENDRSLAFVPIKLKKPRGKEDPSGFSMKDSLLKMKFIMERRNMGKEMLLSFIDRKATDNLDREYLERLKEINIENLVPEIYCFEDCGKHCFT